MGRDYSNDSEREQAQEERRAERALALERAQFRIKDLETTLRAVHDWRGLCDENEIETFDRIAQQFHRETGMMRPGKDDRLGGHDRDERDACWNAWVRAKNAELDQKIRTALLSAGKDGRDGG